MRLSTPSNRGKSRWIWKLAEEKFPPQELQDERQDYVEEMADAVEEILRPLPPQDKIKILRPPQQLSVTEWLLWVADHLYDERSEIVAPCKAAAAAWEYYKEEANRHKLYQMLANRVVPKEEKPQEVRVKKEKAEKSKQVKDLERMLSEAAKRAKT